MESHPQISQVDADGFDKSAAATKAHLAIGFLRLPAICRSRILAEAAKFHHLHR
jgi:hypothetical protein